MRRRSSEIFCTNSCRLISPSRSRASAPDSIEKFLNRDRPVYCRINAPMNDVAQLLVVHFLGDSRDEPARLGEADGCVDVTTTRSRASISHQQRRSLLPPDICKFLSVQMYQFNPVVARLCASARKMSSNRRRKLSQLQSRLQSRICWTIS